MKENVLRSVFVFLGVAVLSVHVYALLTPNDMFYASLPVFDKIEHFLSGFVIAGLFCTTVKKSSVIVVLGIVLLLGLIWELVETQMGYDTKSDVIYDLVFNELGALVGALLILKK